MKPRFMLDTVAPKAIVGSIVGRRPGGAVQLTASTFGVVAEPS